MSERSQASLEAALVACRARGELTMGALGEPEAWTIELQGRRLLLHPGRLLWLRHDPLHDAWYPAGCGLGEALLLPTRAGVGLKRLPDRLAPAGLLAAIGDWCVYREADRLVGPLPGEVARHGVRRGRISAAAVLWSAGATDWLSAQAFLALPPPAAPVPIAAPALPAPSRSCWLIADRGHHAGEPIPLRDPTRLGRAPSCEIVLDDPRASREHALVERREGRWQVVDLRSGNGTSLNGTAIPGPTPLADGDLLQVGDTRLRFRETPG